MIRAALLVCAISTVSVAQSTDPLWRAADHPLGRGRMLPDHVVKDGAGWRLRLGAGRCDGAELRTTRPVPRGEHTVRMRTPYAPGSVSAFFLYGMNSADDNDEIDIEIFDDSSRKALLTSWVRGEEKRSRKVTLPFEPSSALHTYSIVWTADTLTFRADRTVLDRWAGDHPHSDMRLMVNVWWPAWLECSPPDSPRELVIARIH